MDLVESTRSGYRDALDSAISRAEEEQAKLEDAFTSAEDMLNKVSESLLQDKKDLLQAEMDIYTEAMQTAKSQISSLESLLKTLQDYQTSMLTSEDSYLLPDALFAEAQRNFTNAAPEDIPGMAGVLLESARNALTDPEEYARIFAEVQEKVSWSIANVSSALTTAQQQLDVAEYQSILLQAEIDLLTETSETLLTLEQATLEYNTAKEALDKSVWDDQIAYYQDELDKLDSIENATLSVAEALSAYQSALVAAIAGGYSDLENNYESELATLQASAAAATASSTAATYANDPYQTGGVTPNTYSMLSDPYASYYYSPEELERLTFAATPEGQADTLAKNMADEKATAEAVGGDFYSYWLKDNPGYEEGGISTGPQSGYFAKLHGTEAIVPLSDGYIPVQVSSSGIDPEVKELLKRILDETKEDKKLNLKIFRVLDRVTGGEPSFQTRAED